MTICVGGTKPPTRYAAGTKPAARQAGAYFVTIVAWQRECLFGKIVDGEMKLNQYGEIIRKWWDEILNHFPNIETGAFVVMPNHFHGIIIITEDCRGAVPAPSNEPNLNFIEDASKPGGMTSRGEMTSPLHRRTLGHIVAYFKYQSTKEMNQLDGSGAITRFWQRNYYEHIIRNERDLQNKTDYIEANPMLWDEDDVNPINVKS